MTRLPGAIFIVDILREKIAVKEAQKLNIPIFAMVDTNSDPRGIDYVIPANDDASKSISKILEHIGAAIQEGLEERNSSKEQRRNTDTIKKHLLKKHLKKLLLLEAKKHLPKKHAEEALLKKHLKEVLPKKHLQRSTCQRSTCRRSTC